MSHSPPPITSVDPFDLPEWLGAGDVLWQITAEVIAEHHVAGEFTAAEADGVTCDVLAIDQAYPSQVADSGWRRQAHQAWRHDQVLIISYDGRLTLAVPGYLLSADLVLDALARFANAVGAKPHQFTAALGMDAFKRSRQR